MGNRMFKKKIRFPFGLKQSIYLFLLVGIIYLLIRQINGYLFAALVILAVWEKITPRRRARFPSVQRWTSNLGIFVFNTSLIQLAVIPVFSKFIGGSSLGNWALLDHISLPSLTLIIISILLLDLTTYWIHRMFHAFSWSWKIHRVHHADLDMDVTTAQRFHPLEILVSVFIMQLFVLAIGPPMSAFVFYNISVFLVGIFRHANIELPNPLQRLLNLVLVTPDMHLIHHSLNWKESNSNFGTNFPWWDRLFKTFLPSAKMPFSKMTLGISQFRGPEVSNPWRILALPFLMNRSLFKKVRP